MAFAARCFWHPKDLDLTRDYEDAFAVSARDGRAAIADGVASAIFSRHWAQILTAASVAAPPDWSNPESVSAWLTEQRRAWTKAIDVPSLPWMQKLKLQESGGGYAAFLWVELGESGTLRAVAIGDCCLFHVRDGVLLHRFPLTCAADFDRDPAALASSNRHRDRAVPFVTLESQCLPGDWIVLSTDALAKWLYKLSDAGEAIPWEQLWRQDEREWTERVGYLRDLPSDERIRVDDTTLVILVVGAPGEALSDSETIIEASRAALQAPAQPLDAMSAALGTATVEAATTGAASETLVSNTLVSNTLGVHSDDDVVVAELVDDPETPWIDSEVPTASPTIAGLPPTSPLTAPTPTPALESTWPIQPTQPTNDPDIQPVADSVDDSVDASSEWSHASAGSPAASFESPVEEIADSPTDSPPDAPPDSPVDAPSHSPLDAASPSAPNVGMDWGVEPLQLPSMPSLDDAGAAGAAPPHAAETPPAAPPESGSEANGLSKGQDLG